MPDANSRLMDAYFFPMIWDPYVNRHAERIRRKLIGLPRRSLLVSCIWHVDVLYVIEILRHVD